MKKILFAVSCLLLCAAAQAAGVEGLWQTIDEDGSPKSVVSVYEKDGKIYGRIVFTYEKMEDGSVKKAPASKAAVNVDGAPSYEGLLIIWNLQEKKGEYSGGNIMDPASGTTYKANMKLDEGKLKVRGYVGISLAGRTQTWVPYTEKITVPDFKTMDIVIPHKAKKK
ncbi:DUF2147 family protein [Elusimicrobium posterum]|uniref:DUF2147 domain-containing protein n=1 Tax=Elusimicrobium posterum TaxID=3116653 RepID=UPI003C755671